MPRLLIVTTSLLSCAQRNGCPHASLSELCFPGMGWVSSSDEGSRLCAAANLKIRCRETTMAMSVSEAGGTRSMSPGRRTQNNTSPTAASVAILYGRPSIICGCPLRTPCTSTGQSRVGRPLFKVNMVPGRPRRSCACPDPHARSLTPNSNAITWSSCGLMKEACLPAAGAPGRSLVFLTGRRRRKASNTEPSTTKSCRRRVVCVRTLLVNGVSRPARHRGWTFQHSAAPALPSSLGRLGDNSVVAANHFRHTCQTFARGEGGTRSGKGDAI